MRGKTVILLIGLLLIAGGIYLMMQKNIFNLPSGNESNNTGNAGGTVCAQDVNQCADGSFVGRNPNNNCEFYACPTGGTGTHYVNISGFAFSPSTLTISAGDTVTWTNMDSASHTITSDSGTELASSSISNGGTYSHTFNTKGTFGYHCSIHTTMKGTIVVE